MIPLATIAKRGMPILVAAATLLAGSDEVHPGVRAGRDVASLPIADTGYDVYLVGELHGLRDNARLQVEYLAKLAAASGLRDVAIEEDAVYEPAARDYVEGRSERLPAELCLRADVLDALRVYNHSRPNGEHVRVHLVDIDTPASAILEHFAQVRRRISGPNLPSLPSEASLKTDGLGVTDKLAQLTQDPELLRQLRTIRHSIGAYQAGLEAGTMGTFKGSPYLEDRETAIASNLRDIVQQPDVKGVLALYGSDHVSKKLRTDGGPERNQEFAPMALRLVNSGLKVYSLLTYPLSGRLFWRTGGSELFWTAADGALSSGEHLDAVFTRAGNPQLLYIDRHRERVRLPSQDASNFEVDAYVLMRHAEPMQNRCTAR